MKRYTLHTFSTLALLLAATACTQDDVGTLPDGMQPLMLTAAIEGNAETRATVDNRWNGNETIALQVTDGNGTEWYDYTVDDKGNLSGDYYWTNPSSITVQGLYPNIMVKNNDWTWSVEEDQSSDEAYQSGDLLCSESKAVSFAQTPALTFYHQTAKVVVNIKQEGLPTSIGATADNISLTIGEGDILTMDGSFSLPTAADSDDRWLGTWASGSTKGSIKPHLATTTETDNFATYEAFVIPQSVAAGSRLFTFTAEKDGTSYGPFYYTLKNNVNWNPGYVYTYDITVFHYGLEVQVSEGINWENGATGSGSITLKDYTYDESTKTYSVYTAEGLDAWAEAANQDLSTNCTLMTDIDLSGVNWEPVAFGNYNTYYTGTFDGNGHTISNLTITNLYFNYYCGMFGSVGTNATIKNLTLENVSLNVSSNEGLAAIGALAGSNQGIISNCNVSGNISTNSRLFYVGGIVGRMDSGVIQYCHSSASIQGGNSTYVGGVLGGEYATATVIKGCSFSGSITSDRAVGGVAGYCRFFNDMIGCYSVGELSNLSTTAYRTGGVVGFLQINTTANACYWSNFDGVGVGYCNENNQWDGAYKVDGEAINWAQATEAMNAALGTDATYLWHTDAPDTPPTLVPNN
ncbi:fimbrillin family protein [Bacteroides ndongoniae]|uniref:fimbrillin family protein n=1 Tax=Bacteroides ndongoniae TaxID=1903262 RepID=UPI0008DA2D76|nr:fimbrillin family protein [Bacteroides ndongoniae]